MLPFSELSCLGICRPAEGGCALDDRGGTESFSLGGTSEESMVPDFRLTAFWIGLSFTRANGPALLGVAAVFRLDFFAFLAFELDSVGAKSSPPISTSAFGSKGEVAFELGAVLGFV